MQMVNNILRILQFLWTLLITALIGNAIASYDGASGQAKSSLNFAIFVAVLSWIALLYGLIAGFVTSIAIPIALLVLDGLSVLFTFIAAVVLAARLGAVNCSHIGGKGSNYIAYGTGDDQKQCRLIQASDVFFWFLFACYVATMFFAFRAFRGGAGGSVRSRGPNMSQVGV